jgi:hypothetical protein
MWDKIQKLRPNGWVQFLERVTLFCGKHGVDVPSMDGNCVPYGISVKYAHARKQTNDDTSEEKYILVSLINLVKSLIISFMRKIWSYFLVCWHSVLQTHLLLLMHRRYAD